MLQFEHRDSPTFKKRMHRFFIHDLYFLEVPTPSKRFYSFPVIFPSPEF